MWLSGIDRERCFKYSIIFNYILITTKVPGTAPAAATVPKTE